MDTGPVPLLIGLHGAGDSGDNFIQATGLVALATANAFVVVGPYGYNAGWFVQQNEGWPGADGNSSSLQNDIAFMELIIEETSADYWIDPDRIYAVGHSRGGGFTALLAITSGQMTTYLGAYESPFAAYGVNAGYDPFQGQVDAATAAPKRPVWVIHGTADGVVQFSWGEDLANDLTASGWDVTFTPVTGGSHTWLWQPALGQTNQDLWDYFLANALP
jgi:polyhydroxybutyrate depolymerase